MTRLEISAGLQEKGMPPGLTAAATGVEGCGPGGQRRRHPVRKPRGAHPPPGRVEAAWIQRVGRLRATGA